MRRETPRRWRSLPLFFLSRYSQTAVVGYPDWSKSTEFPHDNAVHTIPKDGWIVYVGVISKTVDADFFVNGKHIAYLRNDAVNRYCSDNALFVPVQKGDLIQAKGTPPLIYTFFQKK